LLRKSVPQKFAAQIRPLQWAVPPLICSAQEGEGSREASRTKDSERNHQMAHFTRSGLWQAEREHTPRECEGVECKDCFESVAEPDEDYCCQCGDPLCEECQNAVADEPLCAKCFAAWQKATLTRLQNDPEVGDIFRSAA
jgi:hypothetical protein